jgi:uncharacterized iron-regulated protein
MATETRRPWHRHRPGDGCAVRYRTPSLASLSLAAALAACSGVGGRPPAAPPGAGPCVPPARWVRPASRLERTTPEVIARAARSRIVLLGELHDRSDHHRWQLQTIAELSALRPTLVLGFEMFPRRVQPVLDRWVAGQLDAATFLREADWTGVWGFPPEQYLPLFEFARLNRVPMRALNVDRALVARVGREGWAAIPASEREGVSDPAPASPAYEATLTEALAAHAGQAGDQAARRRFVEAQLTWDRALAEGLAQAARDHPHALVVGVMGSGHLEHGHGVPHQLAALGLHDVTVLLPWDTDRDCAGLAPDLADAVFGIAPAATGAESRPRLGVTLEPAAGSVRVTTVSPGSVAARAGLRPGDVVVQAAGVAVASPADLRAVVDRQAPGTWLPLRVRRAGRDRRVVVRFEPAS